jgi:hypothetical protein
MLEIMVISFSLSLGVISLYFSHRTGGLSVILFRGSCLSLFSS